MPTPFLALLAVLLPAPQDPPAPAAIGDVLARCTIAGRDVAITRTDVALEMAFHLRRREDGRAGCEYLADTALVRLEAEKLGVMPTREEVRRAWNQQVEAARALGQDPRKNPVIANFTEDEWLDQFAITIALERVVRKELGSKPGEPVGPEMHRLWTAEARKKHAVELDPEKLPLGAAARVDGKEIPLADLGLLLLRRSDGEERDRFVRQIAYKKALEAACAAEGIEVTPADLDAEVERRRAATRRDPRWQGLGYEQVLKSQGLTIESLKSSPVFRAHVQLRELAEKRLPREALEQELAADRASVLALVGPRRHLGIVFLRALEPPNQLVPRDFAAATAHAVTVKQRLAKEAFDHVARVESDEPASKARGGDVGWHVRRSQALPDAVLAAAFALEKGEVADPVRGPDGVYLVKALDVEPDPTDDELIARLREHRQDELGRDLLRASKIVRPDGTPLDPPSDAEDAPADASGDARAGRKGAKAAK